MAHGISEVVSDGNTMKMAQNAQYQHANQQQSVQQEQQPQTGTQDSQKTVSVTGSRRIFPALFKIKVLDSYRSDIDVHGNQRATARKYGIHRRQIQKWLQVEDSLRSICAENNSTTTVTSSGCCAVPVGNNAPTSPALNAGRPVKTSVKTEMTTLPASSSPLLTNGNSNKKRERDNKKTSDNNNINMNNKNKTTMGVNVVAPIAPPVQPATVAPALNLSLARQHGDEQQHQQLDARQGLQPHLPEASTGLHHTVGFVPSSVSSQYFAMQHNSVPCSAPSNAVPLRSIPTVYTELKNQYQSEQHQQPIHEAEHHLRDRLNQNHSRSPEITCSYMNTRPPSYGHHNNHTNMGPSYYQNGESYQPGAMFAGLRNSHNLNVVKEEIRLVDDISSSYADSSTAGNVRKPSQLLTQPTSFETSPSPLVLLHGTTIKSERVSPDLVATSGPCEAPSSPEPAALVPRTGHHYYNHQQTFPSRHTVVSSDSNNVVCNIDTRRNLVNGTTVVATEAAAIATAPAAVHSNEKTSSLAHVHMSVNAHTYNSRDSENRQREREHHQLHRDNIKTEYDEGMRHTRVKEEIEREMAENTYSIMTPTTMPIKREISQEEVLVRSRYHPDITATNVHISCPVYQETPTDLSPRAFSAPVSPIEGSTGSYTASSTPRAASTSGISTAGSYDSDIDPTDYSMQSAKNVNTDLPRRRSFALVFKLRVLDAFHSDSEVFGNQRATARKFGINRRQVQKWLGQEDELRGEINLRGGDLRQRLGPIPEVPADNLKTGNTTTDPVVISEEIRSHHSLPLNCCDIGSSSQRFGYNQSRSSAASPESQQSECRLSCCASQVSYPEPSSERRPSSGYPDSQCSFYSPRYSPRHSPRDHLVAGTEGIDMTKSIPSLKRSGFRQTYCEEDEISSKRFCAENIAVPPQDVPLCLVKRFGEDSTIQTELVTSTVRTPPVRPVEPPVAAAAAPTEDGILFKPYLDNPVKKPAEVVSRVVSPQPTNITRLPLAGPPSVIVNNNQGIRNQFDQRPIVPNTHHNYGLELSLRVPFAWPAQHGIYNQFPDRLRSAFVNYPVTQYYT